MRLVGASLVQQSVCRHDNQHVCFWPKGRLVKFQHVIRWMLLKIRSVGLQTPTEVRHTHNSSWHTQTHGCQQPSPAAELTTNICTEVLLVKVSNTRCTPALTQVGLLERVLGEVLGLALMLAAGLAIAESCIGACTGHERMSQ